MHVEAEFRCLNGLLPREGEQGGEIRQTARLISQMRPDPQQRSFFGFIFASWRHCT